MVEVRNDDLGATVDAVLDELKDSLPTGAVLITSLRNAETNVYMAFKSGHPRAAEFAAKYSEIFNELYQRASKHSKARLEPFLEPIFHSYLPNQTTPSQEEVVATL